VRGRLEQFLQLLAPLLLLLLELLQFLLTVLLQQLLELGTGWQMPFLSFFLLQPLFFPRLLPHLLLALLFLFLPLLLDGAKLGRPGHPLRDERGLGLLIHRTSILRRPVAARPITYSDRIPLDPRSGRLTGSLLLLGVRSLDPRRRRWGGLTHQGTGRGALGTGRRSGVGGAYKTHKSKGQSSQERHNSHNDGNEKLTRIFGGHSHFKPFCH